MENAPLTKAHDYARNADAATYSSRVAQAGEAHALAAVSFHEAARETHDAEALRILSLLEEHHQKLARLIKDPPPKKEKEKSPESTSQDREAAASPPPKASTSRATSPSSKTTSPTRAPSRRRLPHSSIASNLAEKRGIPGARRGTPTSSPVSVTNALAARNERQSTPVRDLLQLQSRKADEASRHKEDAAAEEKGTSQGYGQSASSPSNEGFRRFYSAFGDVITAFSAPLAFTALPLLGGTDSSHETSSQRPHSPPEPKPKQSQKSRQKPSSPDSSRTSIKSSEPDLASLISKPALHALRDNQSGTPLGPFAKNESFYLVPTSGGTISYASIVRDPAHPHHAAQDPHLDSIAEGDGEGAGSHLRTSSHEEFVDARESIGPPSPTKPRRHGSTGTSASSKGTSGVTTAATIRAGRGTGLKTMEELLLENETLRAVMDKQAKRLSMWETTSQNSYHALAQSFRARGGYATAGGFKQQNSDPTALAQALAGGAGAPPVPPIPAQFQGLGQGQSAGGGGGGGQTSAARQQQSKDLEKATRKIAELEARLGDLTARLESVQGENAELVKENQHMAKTIGRYREQWEKLKAGARRKEVERREREKAMAGEAGKEKEGEKGGEGESEGKAEKSSDENGNENGNADGVIEDEAGVGFGKA